MQIAVFVSTFPAVCEKFIINQITGLIDRGHIVDLYAFKRGEAQAMHEHIIDYDLLRRMTYLALIGRKPPKVSPKRCAYCIALRRTWRRSPRWH